MSDAIDRAAELIAHALSRHGGHGTYLDVARALDAAGLLAKYPHLEIEGDWLIEVVNYHTCGAGPGSGAGHEPGCGTIPIGRLATPEHDAAVKAEALEGLTYESCGTNRLGQPTRRLVGPVEVEP